MQICNFFIFVSLLVSPLLANATLTKTEINSKIANLSPMPPEPKAGRGIRFGYLYLLRDLRKGIEDWLNPSHPENYLYNSVPQLAFDTSDEFNAHVSLYERILSDYKWLVSTGDIDQYGKGPVTQYFLEEGDKKLPNQYAAPAQVAEVLRQFSFGVHYQFAQLLTILNKQLWDHRYINTFFFSTTVDRRHKPLESMKSLSETSEKASTLVDAVIDLLRKDVARLSTKLVKLSDEVIQGPVEDDFQRRIYQVDLEKQTLNHRIEFLKDSLYKAVQFANDTVRDKKIRLPDLELVVATLGDQLADSISDISSFRDKLRTTDVPRREQSVSNRLTDTYHQLEQILGLTAHYGGKTLLSALRNSDPELPFDLFRESLVLQHVLAVGSIMAKIAELPEGRGGFTSQLRQEIEFRIARLTEPSTPEAGQELAQWKRKNLRPPSSVQRRDFADPALASNRADIEDRLWRIFFEHARLNLSERSMCTHLLTQTK
jgi:hypothetical protein